jgi:hypothetical protein
VFRVESISHGNNLAIKCAFCPDMAAAMRSVCVMTSSFGLLFFIYGFHSAAIFVLDFVLVFSLQLACLMGEP